MYLLGAFGLAFVNNGNTLIADTNGHAGRLVQSAGQVSLIAGISASGGHVPDGPAASAILQYPTAVTVTKDGTIYFVEQGTDLVRKITTAGALVTVAGTFNSFNGGYSGDGGPATSAMLNLPFSLAFDSKGNLYISDVNNQAIRKVDTNGIITTYAGSCNASSVGGFSGDRGSATSALLNSPDALVFDAADNLYIADQSNGRIRKVTPAGIISTIAGTDGSGRPSGDGQSALSAYMPRPVGLAIDAAGNLYVSEPIWAAVRRIGTDGNITTVAGRGLTAGYSGDGGRGD